MRQRCTVNAGELGPRGKLGPDNMQHLAQWGSMKSSFPWIAVIHQQLTKSIWISVAVDVLLQEQENPDFIEPGIVGAEFPRGPSSPAFTVV